MQINLIDDYQANNIPEQNIVQVSPYNLSLSVEDSFIANQQIQVVLGATPTYVLSLSLVDTYSSTPSTFVGYIPYRNYASINLGIIDDYQSLSVITIERKNVVLDEKFITSIIDDYAANIAYSATPLSATPSFSFVVHIIDDFGDTPDEWVLITEDGFIISLEPFNDEFGMTLE